MNVRAEPLENRSLFSAKYAPFTPTDKDESYSLDEIIYRSKNGALVRPHPPPVMRSLSWHSLQYSLKCNVTPSG